MVKLRFIHTADIHLGSFLHVAGESLPPTLEKMVETGTFEGFRRVCHAAIANKVDFLVISGDLYDGESRSVKALSFFAQQCRLLEEANIDVFIIAGNHDPLREKQELFQMPDNVKVFPGDRPESHLVLDDKERPIARLIGQSYGNRWERKKIHLDYRVPDTHIWNIALLHTQLESARSNYVPASIGELKEKSDIHYWALGHIHQPRTLSDTHPIIVYPGIPQGRDFGEEGRGGCMLVELDYIEESRISFIPTASVVYKRVEVFIDQDTKDTPQDIQDLEDLIYKHGQNLLDEELEGQGYPLEGYVVQWILRGRGAIHNLIKEEEQESLELLTNRLRMRFESGTPFLWTDSVSLRTQPPIDYDSLMKNSPILKELDRLILMSMEDENVKAKLIKELGDIWSRDGDHEKSDDLRFHMDDLSLEELLYRAKELIIERLAERGERP
ncbi:MAG: DNA repair exonuclease [Clostridiales bacterium]|nr:DNA repair exonuclease [Clostridiales bacterium]